MALCVAVAIRPVRDVKVVAVSVVAVRARDQFRASGVSISIGSRISAT